MKQHSFPNGVEQHNTKRLTNLETATGEIKSAQLFIATLGASSYTFVEASWSQKLEDWTSIHVRCFEFLGGALLQPAPFSLNKTY